MWPDSKGKGGKDSSPKSKDGGEAGKANAGASGAPGASSGGKTGGKGRNTKTKMKAISAETLATAEQAQAASVKLEQDIIKAAQNMSQAQAKAEETKTLMEIDSVPDSQVRAMPAVHYDAQTPQTQSGVGTGTAANLMRLPDPSSSENMDDKISSLWKSRVLGAYRANPRASQHILPAMPNNRGALEVTEKAKAAAQQEAMIALVDKMFDTFQNLAFEFNSMARASNLELTWIRPVISKENISSWHQSAQIVSVFTGRISTRYWTMVVRGTPDSVLVYCIPADKLLSFSNQPTNFQHVIELVPIADGLTVRWHTMDKMVSVEELTSIHRALLENMIRVAQDDAPSDCLIDLSAYGVTLGGGAAPNAPYVPPTPAPFTNQQNQINQISQPNMANQPHLNGLPMSAQAAPQANNSSNDDDGWRSADEDWKPVVRSVRGANPPVPASPITGSDQDSQNSVPMAGEWKTEPHAMPTAPGFNQDEPWRYSAGSIGNSNASGPSPTGQSGVSGSGAYAGPSGGPRGQFIGDGNDERPLPSLPAHLFEGLPPRPQNPAANAGEVSSPGPNQNAPAQQNAPAFASPWAAPNQAPAANQDPNRNHTLPAFNPSASIVSAPSLPSAGSPTASGVSYQATTSPFGGSTSTNYSALGASPAQSPGQFMPTQNPASPQTQSSDGWKTADAAPRRPGALPPLPVPNYNPPVSNNFISEPASLSPGMPSAESFSSGSIRLDAIAREIAHSQVLPTAVPGFEPYSVVDSPNNSHDVESNAFINIEQEQEAVPAPVAFYQSAPPVVQEFVPENIQEFVPEVIKEEEVELAALFDGSPVNAAYSEPDDSDVIGLLDFSHPKTDEMPWPPGVKGRAELNALEKAVLADLAKTEAANTGSGQKSFTDLSRVQAEMHEQGQSDARREAQSASANVPNFAPNMVPEPSVPLNIVPLNIVPPTVSQNFYGQVDLPPVEVPTTFAHNPQSPVASELAESLPAANPRASIAEGFRMAQQAAASIAFDSAVPSADPVAPVASPASIFPAAPAVPAAPVVPAAPDLSAAFAGTTPAVTPAASLTNSSPQVAFPAPGLSLKADMDQFIATLETELESISDKGSEAFARRDLKGAERLIKLAENLSDFKDTLIKFKSEYGGDLS